MVYKTEASGIEALSIDATNFERERERLHRQMLSSVSHDLKTPLASMIGALEVFQRMKDKLPEDKKDALIAVALQESYRLDNFITNILDMAKFENGMVKAKREECEVGSLVRNCLMRMDSRLRDIPVIFEPAARIEGATDTVLLCRALHLVIENAVKYGGAPPRISIDIGMGENDTAFITVRDNGNGIPEAQMESIFSKYTRYVKEDQQNAGTGLGLAISRAIMALLQGGITASNHGDGGALITLHFPLHQQAPA